MFLFVLAISEVNAFLALQYFTFAKDTIAGCPTLIVFRRRLAWQRIRNSWIAAEEMSAGLEGITSVNSRGSGPFVPSFFSGAPLFPLFFRSGGNREHPKTDRRRTKIGPFFTKMIIPPRPSSRFSD